MKALLFVFAIAYAGGCATPGRGAADGRKRLIVASHVEMDAWIRYVVDTQTHLCFSMIGMNIGGAAVPCENLKRDPELTKYITWVDEPKETTP